MKILHAAFLCACALEVVWLARPFRPILGWSMLAIVILAQGLRLWTMRALGRSWNARVVVVPGARVVTDGPYRFLRHPNYLAVVLEGIAVPLAHGAWVTASIFTILNGCLLATRIRCEEQALATQCADAEVLQERPRLVPRLMPFAR